MAILEGTAPLGRSIPTELKMELKEVSRCYVA